MQENLKNREWGTAPKHIKVFNDFAAKYKTCPLCNFKGNANGKYEVFEQENVGHKCISVSLSCPHCRVFQLKFVNTPKLIKGKWYNDKAATFHFDLVDYIIYYNTKYSNSVLITFRPRSAPLPSKINWSMLSSFSRLGQEDDKKIRLPFKSLDNWFVPITELKKKINKYLMLM